MIRVEFYGIPRARAGIARIELPAHATLGELLESLGGRFPHFARECLAENRLRPEYVANLDGTRFVRDPQTPLGRVHSVLILSADAGG